MRLFLILIGLFWTVFGTLTLFTTDLVKKKFCERFRNINFKNWAALPIIFGILFLMSAPLTSAKVFINILGIISLLKGVYFILMPQDKLKRQVEWLLDAKKILHKIWGLIILLLGVFVLINL